jgi:NADPH:quinone reductase-like Zn-dependent oxidoreductase
MTTDLAVSPAPRIRIASGTADVAIKLGRRQVLIEVQALGLPVKFKGVQAAGTVSEVGADVRTLTRGDEVLTLARTPTCRPWSAPYLLADASELARKPPRLSWECAAALPMPALTARQALCEGLSLRASETVLIHGAQGVVGRVLVQLAVWLGAEVVATAETTFAPDLIAAGARYVVAVDDLEQLARLTSGEDRPIDAAVNAAAGQTGRVSVLLPDPARITCISTDEPTVGGGSQVQPGAVRPDGRALRALAHLAAQGTLTVDVAATYPMCTSWDQRRLQQSRGFAAVVFVP